MKSLMNSIVAGLALFLLTQFGQAQVASRPTLTLEGARRAISAAIQQAHAAKATGVFAVVDDGGNLIALERLDQTFAAGTNISIGKARTAALFKKPTKFFEDVIKNGRTAMTALPDFTPLQGGVPIVVDGQVVGAIGVSGASSAQQDEEFALAGAASVTATALAMPAGTSAESSRSTLFFPGQAVATAFAKGAPLHESPQFKIHASRREKPGQAEVHAEDTDIIYVLEGSSTFVTGGVVEGPHATGSAELRGDRIEGGETRTLSKGDVAVVPAGTPHWFKEVNGPLLYYVVKVTLPGTGATVHAQ
jgi:uncharacterized protein GlcG (DUF336 family)/quercetin dioxygenase-like cupin family protein